MGISTVASYTGAQVFEAVGLSQDVVDRYFTGTTSQARRRRPRRHRRGGRPPARARRTRVDGMPPAHRALEIGGEYQWRREGEPHLFDPETVFRLQHSTRTGRYDIFKQYTARVDEQSERLMTLRGLFGFKDADAPGARRCRSTRSSRSPRSSSGSPPARCPTARSSQEAHETLAIAMNRLGGKSNTGEGGEDADRLYDPERRSVDQAGRLRPLRRDRRSTSPTPTTSRSRWRRAPSPARAASCPATRSTRGSPRPGTRTPGRRADLARRRTTTSTRSRTWRS